MTIKHLALATADLCIGLIDEELNRHFAAILQYMGVGFPVSAVAALSDDWEFVPQNEYDPQTFNEELGVPETLTDTNRVVEHNGYLFVYGDDGEHAFYWKLQRRSLSMELCLEEAVMLRPRAMEMLAYFLQDDCDMVSDDHGLSSLDGFDLLDAYTERFAVYYELSPEGRLRYMTQSGVWFEFDADEQQWGTVDE